MGRMYQAQFNGVTWAATTALDFFEVLAATGKPVLVHGYRLFQTSDLGDAAEEILRIEEVRGFSTVTSGSGGSTPTIYAVQRNDAAAGVVVEANNTTRLAVGTGTLQNMGQIGWNIRIPLEVIYTPEMRPLILPGEYWSLGMTNAGPTDALTGSGMIWLEEIA